MRRKTCDKGDVHGAFPQFGAEYTLTLYFKTLHWYCVYPAEKKKTKCWI